MIDLFIHFRFLIYLMTSIPERHLTETSLVNGRHELKELRWQRAQVLTIIITDQGQEV